MITNTLVINYWKSTSAISLDLIVIAESPWVYGEDERTWNPPYLYTPKLIKASFLVIYSQPG